MTSLEHVPAFAEDNLETTLSQEEIARNFAEFVNKYCHAEVPVVRPHGDEIMQFPNLFMLATIKAETDRLLVVRSAGYSPERHRRGDYSQYYWMATFDSATGKETLYDVASPTELGDQERLKRYHHLNRMAGFMPMLAVETYSHDDSSKQQPVTFIADTHQIDWDENGRSHRVTWLTDITQLQQ